MRGLLSFLAALALLAGPAVARAADTADDPVVAIVNGEKILKRDLQAAQESLPDQYRQLPLEVLFDPLLTRVIDSRLLVSEAERRDLEKRNDVKEAMARARREVLRNQLLEITVNEAVTNERLQQAYVAMRQQPGFASEEVHAHHVLVKSEAEAREVLAELAKGADFATLAKARSTDPSAKENGGDLGFFTRETMVPEFADAAFGIEPGTIGKEPVQSQFGWHVIKVDERRTRVPTFEEKEAELRDQVAREVVTALLDDVRKGANVQRFNLDGSPRAN